MISPRNKSVAPSTQPALELIALARLSPESARQNLRATQIALEKMEIVRMYSWEQVNSNGFVPTSFTAPFFPSVSGSDTNGGVTYLGTIDITKVKFGTTYDDDMREVLVRLNWTNKNVAQSLEMSTYVSQYGMHRYIY